MINQPDLPELITSTRIEMTFADGRSAVFELPRSCVGLTADVAGDLDDLDNLSAWSGGRSPWVSPRQVFTFTFKTEENLPDSDARLRMTVYDAAGKAEGDEPDTELIGSLPADHIVGTDRDLALFLGGDVTSFTGDLLRLIAKADWSNRDALRVAFPHAVIAWNVWHASGGTLTARQLLSCVKTIQRFEP